MSAKLVVDEIPASATTEDIHEFFSAIGCVLSVNELRDATSRSWIIEMESIEEAKGLMEQLDGVIQIRLTA